MRRFLLEQLAGRLASLEGAVVVLWLGLFLLSITLFILGHTRMGREHLLRKCLALSLVAHLLLVGYATTVKVVVPLPPRDPATVFQVTLDDGDWWEIADEVPDEVPPEADPGRPASDRVDETAALDPPETPLLDQVAEDAVPPPVHAEPLAANPAAPGEGAELAGLPQSPGGPPQESPAGAPTAAATAGAAESGDEAGVVESGSERALPGDGLAENPPLPLAAIPAPRLAANAGSVDVGDEAFALPLLGQGRVGALERTVPRVYQWRVAANRPEIARLHGATGDSEAAVAAALKWLADNQEPDGRWNPARHGAGQELRVLGRDRFGAGADADTGISALALLAFLASGHTQCEGDYRDQVGRGLEYLLRSQAPDGNLGGKARTYAFMYCHAMATLALSEAYGMTGEPRLDGPVRRAVRYTVAAQNPTTGGWRYHIGDEGDTSQLGWQLMALKSAELAGVAVPPSTRQAAIRFLGSVSSGRSGGLAAYRPVEAPSRSMTAEALACRYYLGIPPGPSIVAEATEYLMAEVPGEGKANFYYWYYATLGLYQAQGPAWERWNAALQQELLARQQQTGPLAGSWDPNTVWGGYGGRVYTTAVATLCLEIYYRFMPLYVEAAAVSRTLR
ncbi:MAG: prenyltransferase/squalene oxidase repeat-containing protein [Thermoguttaceae bacterium]